MSLRRVRSVRRPPPEPRIHGELARRALRSGNSGCKWRAYHCDQFNAPQLQLFRRLVLLPCDSLPTPWRRTFESPVMTGRCTRSPAP